MKIFVLKNFGETPTLFRLFLWLRRLSVSFLSETLNTYAIFWDRVVVDFTSSDSSTALNSSTTSNWLCSMLQTKAFWLIDYVVLLVAVFVDQMCREQNGMISVIRLLYFEIVNWMIKNSPEKFWRDDELESFESVIQNFQAIVGKRFSVNAIFNVSTETIYASCLWLKGLLWYGNLNMLWSLSVREPMHRLKERV